MPVIHPALPNNGDDAIVDVYNAAITAILAVLNGGIDTTNIASVAGASIVAGSIPMTAMDATVNAGWIPLSQSFTYGANNGQKEFTITTNADLTSIIPVGARFEFTRGTVPPTQAMRFVKASSQWANKATPSGYTFTGALTNEAWIFLTSYPSGSAGTIIGRRNAAVGCNYLRVDTTGQLSLLYGDGAGNFTQFQTTQSLPLNRWIHVAGVVTSVASKTGVMYLNGTIVPSSAVLSAATTLVQTGDLGVGGYTGATETFDGYISEARVWGVAQTQAAIQSNMGLSLTGSETNLVALFQGNGSFNDKTANANNLSAVSGAIATQLANPYNAVEIALVTKNTYVNPTGTLTLFCGTDYMVPNMALLNPKYAIVKVPLGFPASKYKWMVDYKYKVQIAQTVVSNSAWLNTVNVQFQIPAGDWDAQAIFSTAATCGVNTAFIGSRWTLSTANNTQSNDELSGVSPDTQSNTGENDGAVKIEGLISNAAQTTWFLNSQPITVSGTTIDYLAANNAAAVFRFFSVYV